MTRDLLRQCLENEADARYRVFASSLIPKDSRGRSLLGVRLPRLRQLARATAQEAGYEGALRLLTDIPPDATVEEIMLLSMLPGYLPCCPAEERLNALSLIVPQLSNWSLCDSCCATCHFVRRHRETVWAWLQPFLHSPEEYQARFGVVLLLQHYLQEETWAQKVAADLPLPRSRAFYADMAVAWCLCELAIRYPSLAAPLLEEGRLPESIRRRARQKMRESRRHPRPENS